MTHPISPARVSLVFLLAAGVVLGAQTPQRTAYVSVTNRAGDAILDVAPSDFVVHEDKMNREVLEAGLADEPMQIAIIIDDSPYARVRDYREGLTAFVTAITSNNPSPAKGKHQIAIVGTAGRPTILKDYTSDQAQLLKTVQSIFEKPGTGPCLVDAIYETSQGALKRSGTRTVFIAITTNAEDVSDTPYDRALLALKNSGASLNVLKIGSPAPVSHDVAMATDQGSKATGGRNEELLASSTLTAKLKQIANDLTHQYRVTFTRSQSLVPPETLTVTVKRPDVIVRSIPAREERQVRR